MQLDHTSIDGIYQGKHVFSTLALQVWGLYLFDSTKKRLLIELVDHKWDILATIILVSVRNLSPHSPHQIKNGGNFKEHN